MMRFISKEVIFGFFRLLDDSGIEYVLIKNINNELPSQQKRNKDIDILVHPKDYRRYKKLLSQNGYYTIWHPHGRANGWGHLYGMEKVTKKKSVHGLEVDACAQLCCKSTLGNMWVPLDRSIQSSIWRDRIWDGELRCWRMDDKNLAAYLPARCILDKSDFPMEYRYEITKMSGLYGNEEVREKLRHIFFDFTDTLISMIENKAYDGIIEAYYSYGDY